MKRLLSDFICLVFPREDDKEYSWLTITGVLIPGGSPAYRGATHLMREYGMGAVGFLGPIGFTVSTAYFGLDTYGWDKTFNNYAKYKPTLGPGPKW